jgi:hypothetical protein
MRVSTVNGSTTVARRQTWLIVKFKVATWATAVSNSDVRPREDYEGTISVLDEEFYP